MHIVYCWYTVELIRDGTGGGEDSLQVLGDKMTKSRHATCKCADPLQWPVKYQANPLYKPVAMLLWMWVHRLTMTNEWPLQ